MLLSPLQQQTLIAACAGNASSWQLKTLSRQLNRSEWVFIFFVCVCAYLRLCMDIVRSTLAFMHLRFSVSVWHAYVYKPPQRSMRCRAQRQAAQKQVATTWASGAPARAGVTSISQWSALHYCVMVFELRYHTVVRATKVQYPTSNHILVLRSWGLVQTE